MKSWFPRLITRKELQEGPLRQEDAINRGPVRRKRTKTKKLSQHVPVAEIRENLGQIIRATVKILRLLNQVDQKSLSRRRRFRLIKGSNNHDPDPK